MSVAVASAPQLLVVEDDRELLDLVGGFLQGEGYAVTPATSLHTSMEALEDRLFHLVLTDLFRKPEQGHPLQSIQPLIQQATPIPVGVMTAWRVPEEVVAQSNLAFLLPKPFDLDDLLGKIDAQLHPTISSLRQTQMVEEFFHVLTTRDWQRLARLCIPDVRILSLKAPAVAAAEVGGLLSLQTLLERRVRALPGYTIEGVRIFPRPIAISARYIVCWQGRDGIVHRTAGAMHFQFQRGRIAQIDGAF